MTPESEHHKNINQGLTFKADSADGKRPFRQALSEHVCLFCFREENFNQNPGTAYICGSCIQLLLIASQDELKRAHRLAVDKGYDSKVKVLGFFIIPERHHEQRKPKRQLRININRKRSFRPIRNKEERIRLATA